MHCTECIGVTQQLPKGSKIEFIMFDWTVSQENMLFLEYKLLLRSCKIDPLPVRGLKDGKGFEGWRSCREINPFIYWEWFAVILSSGLLIDVLQ